MRKVAEYRGMSDEQLALTLREVVQNLFHLRFQSATERLETPSEIKKARREVARLKTIQRERELAAAVKAAQAAAGQQPALAQPPATAKGK
jgi:large subunit ribosomal protein L29